MAFGDRPSADLRECQGNKRITSEYTAHHDDANTLPI